MEPALPRTRAALAALLEARGLRLSKRFGQSFLVEPALADAIVAQAGVTSRDAVLEIGPGAGGLTQPLLAAAARVTALEIDRGLHALLEERLGALPNFELVLGDCLDATGDGDDGADGDDSTSGLHPAVRRVLSDRAGVERVLVVANLPYSCGTPALARLLRHDPVPDAVVAMLQKEVVDRLTARPGTKDYCSLTVLVQATSEVEILRRVPPSVFFPRPQVESVVFRVAPDPERRAAVPDVALLDELVSAGFGKRRKTLSNALSEKVDADTLRAAGIDPRRRAESLEVTEWVGLTAYVAAARAALDPDVKPSGSGPSGSGASGTGASGTGSRGPAR